MTRAAIIFGLVLLMGCKPEKCSEVLNIMTDGDNISAFTVDKDSLQFGEGMQGKFGPDGDESYKVSYLMLSQPHCFSEINVEKKP